MPSVKPEPLSLLDAYIQEPALASELSVTVRTLQRWRALRKGPPWTVAPGRRILYRREGVLEWLRQREVGGMSAKRRRAAR